MIETAILLAAGEGSRLRPAAPFKPLCPVAGRPLLDHAVQGLAEAGLRRVIVVLGYGAEAIEAHIAARSWPIAVETVRVEDYRKPNGSSLLAAEPLVAGADALLAMCDHLVDPALYRRMAEAGAGAGARLGVDRRIGSDWVDLDDVTCVATDGERIVAIGKGLAEYDCFDTGVFAIGPALFAALRTLEAPSLTEGMRILAAAGTALAVECGDLDWIDVDDQPALDKAEAWRATFI
ncbi:phosphocholine cytidylyltransferase family protein [Sphingomonas sp. M1-B02]|uniref:phosphocholine cytidylyltransferase family protein n=1 Tax=Sphingomonas sp. M1-B02 TaxID=3114300 RepID=UPI00223F892A|nr:NTP transferase domain-containing protein [Sphingomonas sp. S6-11]UZK65005.1 NTP transferase domain-containing protein [Sphingomonas sp. S6-11]